MAIVESVPEIDGISRRNSKVQLPEDFKIRFELKRARGVVLLLRVQTVFLYQST